MIKNENFSRIFTVVVGEWRRKHISSPVVFGSYDLLVQLAVNGMCQMTADDLLSVVCGEYDLIISEY